VALVIAKDVVLDDGPDDVGSLPPGLGAGLIASSAEVQCVVRIENTAFDDDTVCAASASVTITI
jgi:hypothetical protein